MIRLIKTIIRVYVACVQVRQSCNYVYFFQKSLTAKKYQLCKRHSSALPNWTFPARVFLHKIFSHTRWCCRRLPHRILLIGEIGTGGRKWKRDGKMGCELSDLNSLENAIMHGVILICWLLGDLNEILDIIFNLNPLIYCSGISCEAALRWLLLDLANFESTSVQVIVWYRSANCSLADVDPLLCCVIMPQCVMHGMIIVKVNPCGPHIGRVCVMV